ncbi:class V chitinase Chi100 [Massarina eburnea CBS 473.64]|uniref:chitinase n=1 Tax=Massarina eburnea CBS 473.64 TaxID=1395130 RepID=A0A6A6RK17_9PLEO|nr:class V chitinase Chi100 [Massarina eburnea CBS 473.64]
MKVYIWTAYLTLSGAWGVSTSSINLDKARKAASVLLSSISIRPVARTIPGIPTDLASARASILAGNHTSLPHHQTRLQCPPSCSSVGVNTSSWFTYGSTDMDQLKACNKPMLLDFALFNPFDDQQSQVSISACTEEFESVPANATPALCFPHTLQQTEFTSNLTLEFSGASSSALTADVITALDQLSAYSEIRTERCNENIKYILSGSAAVGVYIGSGLASQGVPTSVLKRLSAQVRSNGSVPENLLAQLCSGPSARYSLGVFVNTQSDLGSVQRALQTWKNSSCVTTTENFTPAWHEITYLAPLPLLNNTSNGNRSRSLTARSPWNVPRLLGTRDDCRTVQVQSGDSCASLAAECGISASDFTKYNPSSTLCSSLAAGQHVCCSSGTLPDFTPKPGADGYCYSYLVKTGDSCASIAATYDLTNEKLEKLNADTWGWNGCEKLFADYNICLSTGYAPMPATVPNAVCGPQVNDTAKAPPGTDLSTLNQCPLNACCNVWGQCGTSFDFCTPSESGTGAPGTAAPGSNGCISNCGTDIVTSTAPSKTYHIAYFEAFNWRRTCLRMPVTNIDNSAYTHIHYSFITLNKDFSINMDEAADQFPLFRGMVGIKKNVAIGGWTFSTDPSSYMIFRDAVSSQKNRQTVVANVVKFLDDYNLDGIDWDWEYPNEPDVPGIPAGSESETTGYFLLLDELKQKLPTGKTVSITAPASFWYLQYFPIQALSLVVDYIVYMTYDLHGQWDYINKYATPGCPSYDEGLGNCLRSHVNLTESINSLSMITKAGVPSNMIVVGVSSYGRSFQMSTPGCWTEQCTYSGPDSGAYPGRCTNTSGYISNYEIDEILQQNPSAERKWDATSYSNIVVFNDTQWVAYMDEDNKAIRKELYPGLAFLGDADWSVDLQSENGGNSTSNSSSGGVMYVDPNIWASATQIVTALPGVTLIWPPMPLETPTTITFPLWTTSVTYSSLTTRTTTRSDGSTSTYPWYVYVSWLTVLTIPPVTTTAIPIWGVSFDTSQTNGEITLTSSVQPPPFTITINPIVSGTTSIIGATKTTTITGGIIVWKSITYFPPTQTETLGGTTTVIGGKTLPPKIITITPNPHPTTVVSTKDPVINPHPTPPKWVSGKPPGPSSSPGCKGCGLPCIFFCNSDCPFCPPGVFPNNDPNDPDRSSTTTSRPSTTGGHTVFFDTLIDDIIPTGFAALFDLISLSSVDSSLINSMFHRSTSTSTTKPTQPPTTTTTPPSPTPTADCAFWDEGWGWTFEVYNINGWSTDDGSSLKKEESGCGALTGWDWHQATSTSFTYTYFNLPFFMKAGCVERAIVSAGGPKISCAGQGVGWKRKADTSQTTSLAARAQSKTIAVPPVFSQQQIQEFKEFYAVNNTYETYVPQSWSTTPVTSTKLPAFMV